MRSLWRRRRGPAAAADGRVDTIGNRGIDPYLVAAGGLAVAVRIDPSCRRVDRLPAPWGGWAGRPIASIGKEHPATQTLSDRLGRPTPKTFPPRANRHDRYRRPGGAAGWRLWFW